MVDIITAVDGVEVGRVERPASTAEVAEVMRTAAVDGHTVVPTGAGSKLTWALPPRSADLLLDLSGIDEVIEHASGDLIVTAGAGTPLARIQEHVGAAGQRLALDEVVPGATVGGALAANTSGPLRMYAGTLRDLLIGVTVVRADGVVAKAGGKVVKNVAGYDLGKLLVGSLGTLAVITEATFRLHPIPPARRWLTVSAASPEEVGRLAQTVLHSQVVPAALEVDATTEALRLAVLVEGRPDGVEGRTQAVSALLPGAVPAEEPPPGWGHYPWDVTATGDDRATALKLTFRLSGLPDVLTAARGLGLRGSAGTGVAYAALPPDTVPDRVAATVTGLREVCARHGGTVVVLDGPAAVKGSALDVWGPIPALDLMRRVKDEFDPDHRLSPGRFVGGI